MLAAFGPESIREPEEIFLVDRVQHHDRRPLDDFVFQSDDVAGIMHLKQLSLGMMDEDGPKFDAPLSEASIGFFVDGNHVWGIPSPVRRGDDAAFLIQ